MASLFPAPQQYFDNNGNPLAGGKVYFYEAGTTTPKDTYTTQAGTIANSNPVILDSAGRASIWGTGSYKEVVKTSADVTISTKDAVTLGSEINDGTITNAKLANMAANTVKVRAASTSGVPSDVALSASTLLGRGSTGNLSAISISGDLSMDGTVLSSAAKLGFKHRSGIRYSANNIINGIPNDTSEVMTANRLYFVPFTVPESQTYTRILMAVGTGNSGNARLGIYTSVGGVPAALVVDGGTISTTSTGEKEVTISQSLAAGQYFLAIVYDSGGAAAGSYGNSSTNTLAILGISGFGGAPYTHYYHSHTYGALPSTASSVTPENSVAPWLALKV